MTEKRFTLKHINEQHISANLYDNGTFIGSIGMGEELITELLNQLNDENEQLKQFQEKVAETIEGKMGDNVCNDYKMEVLKEIWNELELDEVWFE